MSRHWCTKARANSPFSTSRILNEAEGRAFVSTTALLGQL